MEATTTYDQNDLCSEQLQKKKKRKKRKKKKKKKIWNPIHQKSITKERMSCKLCVTIKVNLS